MTNQPGALATPSILSLGDLLLDLVVRYDPLAGEVDAGPHAVQIHPGGSAANFAVQAARLGATTHFVSRVGRDWAGEMLVRSLTDEGVVSSVRVVDHESTGRVLVMVHPDGQRRMWSYPGASSTLHPSDLDPAWFRALDAFHLTGYSLLRDGPAGAAREALRLARACGAPLCTLDPNPPHLISAYGPARFRDLITSLHFDLIFPNLEEGQLLSGKQDPQEVALDLLGVAPIVALTLGVQGCMIASQDGLIVAEANPVQAATDATGAGDAFAAAFVVKYLSSHNLNSAAQAANKLAAQVVSRAGAR